MNVEVTGRLEELGFTSTQTKAAVSSLTSQLSAAIKSGQLRKSLVLSAARLQSPTLSDVQVSEYVEKNETVRVVPLATAAPSLSPTTTPPIPFSLLGLESTELMIVSISVLVLILLALLLAYWCRMRVLERSRKEHTTGAFHLDHCEEDRL